MHRAAPKARCLACVHLYVTWDPALPRGCRALGFKTRALPCDTVRAASGEECLYFEARPPRPTKEPRRR